MNCLSHDDDLLSFARHGTRCHHPGPLVVRPKYSCQQAPIQGWDSSGRGVGEEEEEGGSHGTMPPPLAGSRRWGWMGQRPVAATLLPVLVALCLCRGGGGSPPATSGAMHKVLRFPGPTELDAADAEDIPASAKLVLVQAVFRWAAANTSHHCACVVAATLCGRVCACTPVAGGGGRGRAVSSAKAHVGAHASHAITSRVRVCLSPEGGCKLRRLLPAPSPSLQTAGTSLWQSRAGRVPPWGHYDDGGIACQEQGWQREALTYPILAHFALCGVSSAGSRPRCPRCLQRASPVTCPSACACTCGVPHQARRAHAPDGPLHGPQPVVADVRLQEDGEQGERPADANS